MNLEVLTYSIVARDVKTGQLGVAVQSHYFSVGSVVTWARAGVGAVATQAMAEVKYGPVGLELMAAGKNARDALDILLKGDSRRETRQVAMVDRRGRVAAHTGSECIPYAGDAAGEGYSCQGNIMRSRRVWTEMGHSFEWNWDMPFPERLIASLEAGERAGGDARGRQSSALLVVDGRRRAAAWQGRLVELRVEDNPEPIKELKRLLRYQRGYEWADKGDSFLSSRRYKDALGAYRKGLELVPEVRELRYWVGISMLKTRDKEKGLRMLRGVFREEPEWAEITKRMSKAGTIAIDRESLEKLLSQ
jgi:uncharacterized Ntn-hydrolase superfamily protein